MPRRGCVWTARDVAARVETLAGLGRMRVPVLLWLEMDRPWWASLDIPDELVSPALFYAAFEPESVDAHGTELELLGQQLRAAVKHEHSAHGSEARARTAFPWPHVATDAPTT